MSRLDFDMLKDANASRVERWHPGFHERLDKWTGGDWSNAMQGEAGEAGNIVKKIRRIECDLGGNREGEDDETLFNKLALEMADVVIYLDLLAQYYGIDLGEAVARKFNITSIEKGFPERLPEP